MGRLKRPPATRRGGARASRAGKPVSRGRRKSKRNPQLLTVNAGRRRKRRPRKNPQLLTINPTDRQVAAAVRAYRQFHGVDPKRAIKLGPRGGVLVALGELREIVYQPRRGARKGPAYFHHFQPGNLLAATPDGKRLVIVDRKNRRAVDFDLGIVS